MQKNTFWFKDAVDRINNKKSIRYYRYLTFDYKTWITVNTRVLGFFLSGDFVVYVVLQLPQGSVLPSTIAEPEDESDESVISQRLVYKKEGVLFL